MADVDVQTAAMPAARRRIGLPKLRTQGGLPWFPMIVLGVLLVCAVIGPAVVPVDPEQNSLSRQLEPPVFAGGQWDRPLGTDSLGRDIFSRIVVGARVTTLVSILGVLISAAIGTLLGMIAGYSRSALLDSLIMRLADITLAFPVVLLGLIFAVQRGPQFTNLILVLGILLWSRFARLARGEVLSWKTRDFISLAIVAGGGRRWILSRHLLPNIVNSIIVLASLQLGWAVLTEASLSFLGAGVPPPQPAWGSMVAEGRDFVRSAWWVATMPGIAIAITVLALNLLGDWLRDELDPHLRQL